MTRWLFVVWGLWGSARSKCLLYRRSTATRAFGDQGMYGLDLIGQPWLRYTVLCSTGMLRKVLNMSLVSQSHRVPRCRQRQRQPIGGVQLHHPHWVGDGHDDAMGIPRFSVWLPRLSRNDFRDANWKSMAAAAISECSPTSTAHTNQRVLFTLPFSSVHPCHRCATERPRAIVASSSTPWPADTLANVSPNTSFPGRHRPPHGFDLGNALPPQGTVDISRRARSTD
jgi:hypothetical protein